MMLQAEQLFLRPRAWEVKARRAQRTPRPAPPGRAPTPEEAALGDTTAAGVRLTEAAIVPHNMNISNLQTSYTPAYIRWVWPGWKMAAPAQIWEELWFMVH